MSSLAGLEGLALEGGTWSTWLVDTLGPIAGPKSLMYLSLVNLRAQDGSLRPLFELTGLRSFHSARWWNAGELEELKRRNPGLESPSP